MIVSMFYLFYYTNVQVSQSQIIFSLQVGTDKKKLKERYVILCDGLLIVCSLPARRSSTSTMAGPASELRYRDKFFIRLINIADREDEEGIKNSFELCPRDQQKVHQTHIVVGR